MWLGVAAAQWASTCVCLLYTGTVALHTVYTPIADFLIRCNCGSDCDVLVLPHGSTFARWVCDDRVLQCVWFLLTGQARWTIMDGSCIVCTRPASPWPQAVAFEPVCKQSLADTALNGSRPTVGPHVG